MKKTVVFIILLLSLCACGDRDAQTVYATVNGEPIYSEEADYFRAREKSDIVNVFAQRYGITDFSGFWESEYAGERPAEALENAVLREAVDSKLRLCLMRDYGIYDDISFSGLQKKAEQFNQSNQNADRVIGLQSISAEDFYTYYIITGEMELKNILGQGEWCPSQTDIDTILAENENLTTEGAVSELTAQRYDLYLEELRISAVIEKDGMTIEWSVIR